VNDENPCAFNIALPRIRANGRGDIGEMDAALYLRCSTRKLRKWRQRNEGPPWRKVAGRIWYPLDGLNGYLDACLHETDR
jgi:hypothetical protein